MAGSEVVNKYLPKVADFYNGKSVFVTGAGGFIGSVLLEILLRNCPGIKYIFILLRSKKNVHFRDRKEQIFKKKIFEKLKVENRKVFEKVQVMAGEVSLPKLGMSEEDTQLIIEEVSIVFHCAATISFRKPLKYTLLNNVGSLNSIIELSRRMSKLKAIVYTSTAYSSCNHTNAVLEEEVIRLPFRAEKFLKALKNEEYEKIEELFSRCKPDWPNTYTFSKCLAENVIKDTASDLPIAIIRPSMVLSTWKNPVPGYQEENSIQAGLILGTGRGFLRVSYVDTNTKLDLVPADIVANTHILAACTIGTKRCASPMIVNCTATKKLQVAVSEYANISIKLATEFPFPQAFLKVTNHYIVTNRYLYYIIRAYHHYLPAIILDAMLIISGKKPKIFSSFRFFDALMNASNFFLFNSFKFERSNLEHLDKLIHPEDKKNLTLDFKDASLEDILSKMPEAATFYDWKTDKESPSERLKKKNRLYLIVKGIQWTFVISSAFSIYCLADFIL